MYIDWYGSICNNNFCRSSRRQSVLQRCSRRWSGGIRQQWRSGPRSLGPGHVPRHRPILQTISACPEPAELQRRKRPKRCPCVLTQYVIFYPSLRYYYLWFKCHCNVLCSAWFLFFKAQILNLQRLLNKGVKMKRTWSLFPPPSAFPSWMDFEIGGCGGQPSIHWAAAQTQSKQMSAGGLNNPNTAAEWKEEPLHNWNATVCSLSTNREWAEWGLYHYLSWRTALRATGHSFRAEPYLSAKEHALKLAFRLRNTISSGYIYEIPIKHIFFKKLWWWL